MGAEARGAKAWGSMSTPRAAPHRQDAPTPTPTGPPQPPSAALRAQQPILTPRCPAAGGTALPRRLPRPPVGAWWPCGHRPPHGRGSLPPCPGAPPKAAGPGGGRAGARASAKEGKGLGLCSPPPLFFLSFYFFFPFPSLSA